MSLKGLEHTGQQSIRYRRALKNSETEIRSVYRFGIIVWVFLLVAALVFARWNPNFSPPDECMEGTINITVGVFSIVHSICFATWFFAGALLRYVRKEIRNAENSEVNHE